MKADIRCSLSVRIQMRIFFALLFSALLTRIGPADGASVIRIAFVPELPPYQFEENRRITGMHIELMDAIAKQQNLTIEYLPMNTLTGCYGALRNHDCDAVLGVLENGERDLLYSSELSNSSIALVVTNSGAEMLNRSNSRRLSLISYEYGTMHSITAAYFTLAQTWQPMGSQTKAFQAMVDGSVDGMYGVQSSILYQLRHGALEDQYTIYYSNVQPIQYRAAVLPENEQFLSALEKGLQTMRASGQYDELSKKWEPQFEQNTRQSLQTLWAKYGYAISLTLGTVIALMAILFLWNRMLNRRVDEKTAQLRSVNEELQNEMARSQYENSLRQMIVESSPNALLLLNEDLKISMINQAGKLLLRDASTSVGSRAEDHPLLKKMLLNKTTALIRDGQAFQEQELVEREENGHERTYQYHLIPVMERDRLANILLNIQDITQSVEREKEIVAAEKNRVLNQIVAGIAHEIRNPLMAIKTFGQLLELRKDQQEFITSFADVVPTEVDRIERLVGNLVSYSSPIKREVSTFRIDSLLDSCISLLQAVARQNNIQISTSMEDDLLLTANPDQIKQVMVNLLMNSIQAIQEKRQDDGYEGISHIDVRGYRQAQNVCVAVTDDGIGMTPEMLERITEPFYTSKATGTGLGMTVSRRYVKANHGRMNVESERNKYTTVTLVFTVGDEADGSREENI